jgi:hypothetical protein
MPIPFSLLCHLVPFNAPASQAEPIKHENSRVPGKDNSREVWRGRVAWRNGVDSRGAEKAHRLFEEGAKSVAVKAQIHDGGRGQGGGVKVAKSLAPEARF